MISLRVRLQLLAFALVTIATVWYGAVSLLDVGRIVNPPYRISAQFDEVGGVYPRADVDLLGTRVGKVVEIQPGPGQGSTVVMAIDDGVVIPADTRAIIGSKSAIGEGFVELEPPRGGTSDVLAEGDTIPLAQTQSPADLAQLLGNLDALAASVPTDDLATVLEEGAKAVDRLGPVLGRMIEDTETITSAGLRDIDATTALIRDARSVLGTQVAIGGDTRAALRELADLVGTLDGLSPRFVSIFTRGVTAGQETTRLMVDLEPVLPGLLRELNATTDLAADRVPGLRKTLTLFPWALELLATSARYCDEYDIDTGEAVESTCHYDDNGDPIYTLHLAQQLSQPGHAPCTRGYEGTQRYTPNGESVDGGARQLPDAEPNLEAHCAAGADDGGTPNVRGAQNVTTPAYLRRQDGTPRKAAPKIEPTAARDIMVLPVGAPPAGGAGGGPLAWLLTQPFAGPGQR